MRVRSGSDIALIMGIVYHVFKNGWEDKKYIHDRVYGMEKVKEEVSVVIGCLLYIRIDEY